MYNAVRLIKLRMYYLLHLLSINTIFYLLMSSVCNLTTLIFLSYNQLHYADELHSMYGFVLQYWLYHKHKTATKHVMFTTPTINRKHKTDTLAQRLIFII